MRRWQVLLGVTTLALLSRPAASDELGKMTMFLEGEAREWHTITMEQGGVSVATATVEQKAHQMELQLQGHPIPEFTSKDVLSVDLSFDGRYSAGDTPRSVEILYTPNGLAGPLWTSRGATEQPRVQIIEFELWGNVGRFTAVVSGEICERPRLFSQTDRTNCIQLNGLIDTRISRK